MIVNWALVRHPENWLNVGIMLTILAFGGVIALDFLGLEAAQAGANPATTKK